MCITMRRSVNVKFFIYILFKHVMSTYVLQQPKIDISSYPFKNEVTLVVSMA